MHPRLAEIDAFLADKREEVLVAIRSLPDPAAHAVPEGSWTAATVVEHLRLVEDSVSKLLHVKVGKLASADRPAETETSSVLTRFDATRLLDRERRVKAPASVQPETGLALATAMAGLEASRARLRQSMTEVDGVALGDFSFPHPGFGNLDLYQWLLFVGHHESRHACQIRELGETRFDP